MSKGPAYSEKQRKRIRMLFIIVMIYLPLQLGVILKWGEFYPAFYMPMFGHVPCKEGKCQSLSHEILLTARRDTMRLSMHDLLPDLQESTRFHVLRERFGWEPKRQMPRDAETMAWLKARIGEVCCEEFSPSGILVRWNMVEFEAGGDRPKKREQPLGQFSVSFEAGGLH